METSEAMLYDSYFMELPQGKEEEIRKELEKRGYNEDTWSKVKEFYHMNILPSGDPEEKARKIESRLYKIYPEKYFEEKFENEEINNIYSVSLRKKNDGRHLVLPFSYQDELELSEFDGVDGVVLDHSVVYSIMERSSTIKLDNMLDKKVEPLKRVLDEIEERGESLRSVDPYGLAEDVKESISKTTSVQWYKPLELMDNILTWRKRGDVYIDLCYPDDLKEKATLHASRTGGNGIYRQIETINLLEDIGEPLDIPKSLKKSFEKDFKTMAEDKTIIEVAKEKYEKPMIVTYDSDFKELVDGEVFSMLPDCANFVLRCTIE